MRCIELKEAFLQNDKCLSRTAMSGVIDTGSGTEKRHSGQETNTVSMLISRSRVAAAEYVLWRAQASELTSMEFVLALVVLSEIVNHGISANGIFRTWPIAGRQYGIEADIAPVSISTALQKLSIPETIEVENLSVEQRMSIIAEIEWAVGIGPLHPFADGCGRSSRYFSSLLCLAYKVPVVLHSARDDYFGAGKRGRVAFSEYYRGLERVDIAGT